MQEILTVINDYLWGSILLYVLLAGGLYFSIKTRFVQFRRFSYCSKNMFKNRKATDKETVSSFQAFCTSLAARVGTGNMAGVAVAITAGGPGAVFWMWVVALLGMSTSLVENTLAQLYKKNNNDGTFRGGPAYYIERALGSRIGGIVFSVSLIIAFGYAFNSVQSHTIAEALSGYNVNPIVTGIIVALLAASIFFGGIKSIAKFSERVVPAMALLYLAVALLIVIINITEIPSILLMIIKSAFGLEQAAVGSVAVAIKIALENGAKRGLFSNEAGMGSAPNAAATATPNPNHPITQGLMGMLGVFVDTIIICTATAALILLSGDYAISGAEGIALTQFAIEQHIGDAGRTFITVAILLFAFTSIIANYYYGETNLHFIFKKKNPMVLLAYRLSVMAMIIYSALASMDFIWLFADTSMGIMALINLTAILLLGKHVFKLLQDYEDQLNQGIVNPVFKRNDYPFLNESIEDDVWQPKGLKDKISAT